MEPVTAIGLVASIVQLIDATAKVIKYVSEVKDAPKERETLSLEAANLMPLLMALKQRVDKASGNDPWFLSVYSLGVVGGPIPLLQAAMEALSVMLKSRKKKLRGHLSWPSDTKDCIAILARIERMKSLIGLALQDDHFKLSLMLKKGLDHVRENVAMIGTDTTQMRTDHQIKIDLEILDWISTQTFWGRQEDILQKLTPGTCDWLLETPEYQSLLSSNDKALWCLGIPGAGKTVFTSYVVDHLKRTFAKSEVGIGYIYCNYKDPDQTADMLIASLLRQLLQSRPAVSIDLVGIYNMHIREHTRPSFEEFLSLLRTSARSFSKTFIVIDALDECRGQDCTRSRLLAALQDIRPYIHLVVTSRWSQEIEYQFRDALRLEIRASDKDIESFVKSRIATKTKLRRHVEADTTLKKLIIEKIVERCHGMFLLAQLHMDSLAKQPHRKGVRLVLENLPSELDDTYSDALLRMASQDKEDVEMAYQVLGWMTYVRRPLTIRELQHALSVEPDQCDLDEEAMIDEDLIITVCLGLVTVDQTSHELRLIHYTAQKYFENKVFEAFTRPHVRIASTCLTYLAFKPCQGIDIFSSKSEIAALEARYALLDYAGLHWGFHARKEEEQLQDQILNLLSPHATYLSSRLMIGGAKGLKEEDQHRHWEYLIAYEAQVSGYHMAAFFGLEHTVLTLLLDKGTELSRLESTLGPALLVASAQGDCSLVRLLLDNNANANATSWLGYTPLHVAAGNGKLAVVKMLLDQDADVQRRCSSNSYTALHVAARNGHANIVRILLHRCSNANTTSDLVTALHLAVQHNHEPVVELLLAGAANAAMIVDVGTVLYLAEGADVNATVKHDPVYHTALSSTSSKGHHTALSIASSKGYYGIVLALLEAGVSINQKLDAFDDSDGLHRMNALNYAIENRHETIVKLLVERGADLRTAYSKFWPPRCRSPYLIGVYLVAGMDVNVVDAHKQTLTFHIASDGQTETVEILGERLACLNIFTDVGGFALYATTSGGHEEIVSLLPEDDVDTEDAVDTEGVEEEVWLQRARGARRRHEDTGSLSNQRRDHEQSPYLRFYFYHGYDEESTLKPFDTYNLREFFSD